jgi:proteasome accessory factor B
MSQKDRTERLLNLLFALMASSRPVPKHVLRDLIDAYRESPSDEAFERMFERDKDELRGMGVPILTVEGADGVGGIEGYRVAAADYALPEVVFSADELAVLGLAARVWEQASLGPAAARAVRKLESLGGGTVVDEPIGVETRIATAEPSFPVLLDAVRTRTPVRFDYRKPGSDSPESRGVQPWGVASRRGHWYLVGLDTGRAAPRVFRLSRVVGTVTSAGASGRYDIPPGLDIAAMIAASAPEPGALSACVRVAPGRAHGLRRRATSVVASADGDLLELRYTDDEVLAAEIVGLGAHALVVDPPALRDAVVRRLRAAQAVGES